MKIAIHQPHYFPWLGYFDKMAKVDAFVLLDQVQLEKGSNMVRNRVLDNNGEIKFLTISGDTKGFLKREYRYLATKNISEWTSRQMNALKNYYRKAPATKEILPVLEQYFRQEYPTICRWTCASVELGKTLLNIETPLLYQSQISYNQDCRKSDLVYAICNALKADTYFSGRGGSMMYLDQEKFAENGIEVLFQDFQHPVYPQITTTEFVQGLSVLDILFNCGIEASRQIFRENVRITNEFGE